MLRSGDLIELSEDMPEHKLSAGTQGIILTDKGGDVYDVDLEDDDGLTTTVTLQRSQFDVIMSFGE
jgi:hypothetical protein